MKNVYIIDEYSSSMQNGIGTFLRTYMTCLKKIGVNLCLIVFDSPQKEFSISCKNGVKCLSFPEFPGGRFLNYPEIIDTFFRLYIADSSENVFCLNHSPCARMLEVIRKSHPLSKILFIIHNQFWTGTYLGVSGKLRSLVKGRKNPSKRNKQMLKCFDEEKEMYMIADAVICLSQDTHRMLTDVYRILPDKIRFIPNGLNRFKLTKNVLSKAQLRAQYAIGEDEKIIIFAGRLSDSKGLFPMIRAFECIIKRFPHARLVIAGSTLARSFRYTSHIAAARITWTGQLSPSELSKWYRMADIGILPSYTEQCSYAGIEMMMYGLPVVASDGYGVRNMFQDGMNAVIAPIGRVKHPEDFTGNLVQALSKLLSSDELLKRIGQGGRKVYEDRYTVRKMQEGYRKLLDFL